MKVLKMLTSEDMKRIKAQADLALLIEHYKKEIWEWKQKESKWISDKNLLEGCKKTIDETATRLVEISKINLALQKDLAREKADRQHDNLVHTKELEKTLKK
jgi:hypothetical protein